VCERQSVTAGQVLRRVRDVARRRGVSFDFVEKKGKGRHGKLYVGSRSTIVKDRKKEIGPGLLRRMCRDLGIDPQDL
jgi:hypothetical protein